MFRRVLIANRGEIALRIMRSLRYLDIEVAIIYGKEDRLSLPVRLADEGIYIPRNDPLASYLDIEAIVKAAVDIGVDAVHPGYGFLAENSTFARRLEEEGIKFIGPNSEVLKILGDKISAREIMAKAGLPIARGSEDPITNVDEAKKMAEEIIDLRDRIEKMRIQIENEATEQISVETPLEIHQKTSNSNISLSMENKNSLPNQNFEVKKDSNKFDNIENKSRDSFNRNESFPAVSLSVKNPVSSKVLTLLVTLQILSNIGILYFLYLVME